VILASVAYESDIYPTEFGNDIRNPVIPLLQFAKYAITPFCQAPLSKPLNIMSYNTFNEDFKFFFSAIALGYNLPGVSNLSLSREQIVGIYSGTFLYWNESTFLETNPNSIFPHAKIFVLARADTSGSTAAFTYIRSKNTGKLV
jgi:hypothetical protein